MKTVICGRGAETGGKSVQVHVLQTLRELGHDVQGFDPLLHGENSEQRLVVLGGLLNHWTPDLVVHVASEDDLNWESFQGLASEHEAMTIAISSGLNFVGAPVANNRLGELVATHDVVVSHDPSQKSTYQGAGSYALFDQMAACNIHALDAAAGAMKSPSSQILVLGDADAANAHIVRDLVNADLEVQIVGSGWGDHADLRLLVSNSTSLELRVSRILATELVVELPPTVTQQSAAQMSCQETGLNLLALEAVALGKPVLTTERAGVEAHLISGLDIFTWQQSSDVASLACMLLSDRDQLNEIALAGQVQLRTNHQAVAHWVSLFDEFSVTPEPLTRRAISTDDLRVCVVVPVDASTSDADLGATLDSIATQTSSVSEVFVVSNSEIAMDLGNQVNSLVASGADEATLVNLAIDESGAGLISVARPGETWMPDRLANQVEHLHQNRDLDLSHGLVLDHSGTSTYHSWSLPRTLLDGQTLVSSTLLVRRSALEGLGSSALLLGDLEAQVLASTRLRCGALDAVVVNAATTHAPVDQVLAQSIASIFPEIERCDDSQQAAAAAFCELGGRVASEHPDLAVELCGIALDHLEELDPVLHAVYSGETPVSEELLVGESDRYSTELNSVVPLEVDRVITSDGRLLGNRMRATQPQEIQNP